MVLVSQSVISFSKNLLILVNTSKAFKTVSGI